MESVGNCFEFNKIIVCSINFTNCEAKKMNRGGFTLIELSIVLVIIGLLIGGILVGRDLIEAAAMRAQISQLEKYQSALNTFRLKYNALPGDLTSDSAASFGFLTRAGSQGRGNGNGLLEGFFYAGPLALAWDQGGENVFFWADLSVANLVDGSFTTAVDGSNTSTSPRQYFPSAKISGNYIYVYSYNSENFFGIAGITAISPAGNITPSMGLTVIQANNIDTKIDDGLPLSGRILAYYNDTSYGGAFYGRTAAPNAALPSSSTCYDTTSNRYSTSQSGGTNMNCSLSIKFQ